MYIYFIEQLPKLFDNIFAERFDIYNTRNNTKPGTRKCFLIRKLEQLDHLLTLLMIISKT